MDRAEKALEVKHQMGINCCQAVLLAYKDELNKTEEELLRLGSGFGGGMGCMEGSCGALIGAVMVASLSGNADTHKTRTSPPPQKNAYGLHWEIHRHLKTYFREGIITLLL